MSFLALSYAECKIVRLGRTPQDTPEESLRPSRLH